MQASEHLHNCRPMHCNKVWPGASDTDLCSGRVLFQKSLDELIDAFRVRDRCHVSGAGDFGIFGCEPNTAKNIDRILRGSCGLAARN
jgi:hypothetical protein